MDAQAMKLGGSGGGDGDDHRAAVRGQSCPQRRQSCRERGRDSPDRRAGGAGGFRVIPQAAGTSAGAAGRIARAISTDNHHRRKLIADR
jgi:hypothetical protein